MAFILLEKVLSGGTVEQITSDSAYSKVSQAWIQAKHGNANVIEVGPSATLAAGKGHALEPVGTDPSLRPLHLKATGENNGINLTSWYVIGTSTQGLNILIETF
jgi:hypothetical protein